MAKSWPGGKTTLYLIAPQRQPPAALAGSFSCIVLFLFDSRENACLGVCLLFEKQNKKSIGGGAAVDNQMLVIHLAGVAWVRRRVGDLVRGNNAPYHGVTGVGGTPRKVLFIPCFIPSYS